MRSAESLVLSEGPAWRNPIPVKCPEQAGVGVKTHWELKPEACHMVQGGLWGKKALERIQGDQRQLAKLLMGELISQ